MPSPGGRAAERQDGVWLRLLILMLTSYVPSIPSLGLCFCVFKMGINLFSMSVSPDMGREEREERERCIKNKQTKMGIIMVFNVRMISI